MEKYKELEEDTDTDEVDVEAVDTLKTKLQQISCMTLDQLDEEEASLAESEATPALLQAIQRRRRWFMFLAFVKAVSLIVGNVLFFTVIGLLVYVLCVYVIKPHYKLLLFLLFQATLHGCNLWSIGNFFSYHIHPPTVADDFFEEALPWLGFVANFTCLGITKFVFWFAGTSDNDDHHHHQSWYYLAFFYSYLGWVAVYAVMLIYTSSRCIYRSRNFAFSLRSC